jgi:hypothetical protein
MAPVDFGTNDTIHWGHMTISNRPRPVRVLRGFAGIFLVGVPKFATVAKPQWVMDRHPALARDTRIVRDRQLPPLNLVVLVGLTEHDPVPIVDAPTNALKPLPQLLCVDLVACTAPRQQQLAEFRALQQHGPVMAHPLFNLARRILLVQA